MNDLILEWLRSQEEQLNLSENNDAIILKRQGPFILLEAQLTSVSSDNASLQSWMRLGSVSLSRFQGVLVRKADSEDLWLIQTLREEREEAQVLCCFETLLNQRDIWRATFARLARPAQNLKPTSLRSLSY